MTKIMLIGGVLLVGACGSKADNALSEFESFKNRMCDCKDKDCAEAVKKDMRDWEKKMREEGMKKKDLSDDQRAKAKELDKAMDECRDKLLK